MFKKYLQFIDNLCNKDIALCEAVKNNYIYLIENSQDAIELLKTKVGDNPQKTNGDNIYNNSVDTNSESINNENNEISSDINNSDLPTETDLLNNIKDPNKTSDIDSEIENTFETSL